MNIFVAKLNFDTDSDRLREVFEGYGEVNSAKVIMDRETGNSKGFGFVEMPNDEEAKAAIEELNDNELDGNTIVVKVAEDRSNDRGGGRGGYNDRRGGGGGYNRGGGGRGGYNDRRGGGGGYNRGGGGYDRDRNQDRRSSYDENLISFDEAQKQKDNPHDRYDDRRGGGGYNDRRGGGRGGYDDRRGGGGYNDRRGGGGYDDRRDNNYDDRRSNRYDDYDNNKRDDYNNDDE
ncbi:MAG TPA: hypothetical protein VJ953_10905 [Saprospiraceae bacterium]|nr:hypothetical protein [Saprospiraceae bacterium]